jgi:hypothetical protein
VKSLLTTLALLLSSTATQAADPVRVWNYVDADQKPSVVTVIGEPGNSDDPKSPKNNFKWEGYGRQHLATIYGGGSDTYQGVQFGNCTSGGPCVFGFTMYVRESYREGIRRAEENGAMPFPTMNQEGNSCNSKADALLVYVDGIQSHTMAYCLFPVTQ